MPAKQSIFKVRREYNQWVGNETLEDYALRFTAKRARRWSTAHIGQTALGAVSFMALEALAATATLQYGFINTVYALLALTLVILLTGIPITYYSARNGLDIDLLTRGAGFGYLGSTVTSLIYASFTFIFFAIEAAIMASALKALFGIPLYIGYLLCVLFVVPIVIHGITAISRFQVGTQAFWLLLQLSALGLVIYHEFDKIGDWTHYAPTDVADADGFNLALFGACSSLFFALVAQIGEQADYLRFLPQKSRENRNSWWFWLLASGPGWIIFGAFKMLLGSFLAYLAITSLVPAEQANDPVYMYKMAFSYATESPNLALALAGVMVVISQMKINVTNAYAGSIAWSNFFSRLTHSHPGRVVWLVFNVIIALVLMELGIYRALEAILGVFAIAAVSWLGCLSADLLINKPLGLSPSSIEFKRSHLYDINPVGFGSMILAFTIGILCYLGDFGETAQHLSHYICLASCFVSVPLLAVVTKGKFYLARNDYDTILSSDHQNPSCEQEVLQCYVCENEFEIEDISHCPAYGGYICSLCCSLDVRCLDACKTDSRYSQQLSGLLSLITPQYAPNIARSKITAFLGIFIGMLAIVGAFLSLVYFHFKPDSVYEQQLLQSTMWAVFYVLLVIIGVFAWLFLLAHESRQVAQQESSRQNALLVEEIDAHKETDLALQQAKEAAEQANAAKTRYLSGISHELRTPLQSLLGYAQLLQMQDDIPTKHQRALSIMRNSSEHLTDLIEGLLEISKIEAGRLEVYRNYIAFEDLLSQLVDIFRQQAENKGLDFHYHVHNPLPTTVIGDEIRLRQILTNLLSNAIKYTVTGRVDFHVDYRYQIAEFEIIDTGVGIESDDLDRIFYPFERIRNLSVPSVSGTGLGLTIVRLLTDVLGGSLSINSTPGQGSSFKVALMLSRSDIHPPELLQEGKRIVGYIGKRKTVLIVDDEAVHRGLIADLLGPIGFTVYEAPNAVECLSLVKWVEPDLFILDVNMPGMNGLALASELRSQGLPTAIIMLSADAHQQYLGDDTYNEYLTKPVRHKKLLNTVGKSLELQWVYGQQEPMQQSAATIHAAVDFSQVKPDPLLKELLECAKIGHRKAVVETLTAIEAQALLSAQQLAHLNALADAMRFNVIEEILSDVPFARD